MKDDKGHSHRYDSRDQRSTSQPGVLEKDDEDSPFNNKQIEGLITKTSEIDQLTSHTIHKDYKYTAVWIGLAIVAGMAMIYLFEI